MDPLTMATLAGISAGGTLIGSLPQIIPTKAERELKKDLKNLQRREELGLLGLTPEEQRVMEGQMQAKISQSQAYADAERKRIMSSPQANVQGGEMLLAQTLSNEAATRAAGEMDRAIAAENLRKKQAEEQLIRDMEAAQGEYSMQRREALAAPFVAGAQTALSTQVPTTIMGAGYGGAGLDYASALSRQLDIPYADAQKMATQLQQSGQTELLNYFALVR